jgi:hypothetical protein
VKAQIARGDWVEHLTFPRSPVVLQRSRRNDASPVLRGASTTIRVRRALLFYALKRLGLDIGSDVRPPNEQHIILLNRDEIQSYVTRRGETREALLSFDIAVYKTTRTAAVS